MSSRNKNEAGKAPKDPKEMRPQRRRDMEKSILLQVYLNAHRHIIGQKSDAIATAFHKACDATDESHGVLADKSTLSEIELYICLR